MFFKNINLQIDLVSATNYIINWLKAYLLTHQLKGFVVGISGGIDSALVSTLCAETELPVLLLNLPIRQHLLEQKRAQAHIEDLLKKYPQNMKAETINLTSILESYEKILPTDLQTPLNMANLRARLRMTTLYAFAGANSAVVVGTGNKIEDFGIGFFTKYGDGGVDLNPIADLYKSEVYAMAEYLGVIPSILEAAPTDGLFAEERTDEMQIGASYEELEWVMRNKTDKTRPLNDREKEVLKLYQTLNSKNQHKMTSIPVCNLEEFRFPAVQ